MKSWQIISMNVKDIGWDEEEKIVYHCHTHDKMTTDLSLITK